MQVIHGRKPMSLEHKQKISFALTGRTLSNEHIAKISGSNNYNFKGENIGYERLHFLVAKYRGKPSLCEDCGTTTAKKFEWANISGLYVKDFSDFKRLCTSCHRKFDMTADKREKLRLNSIGNTNNRKAILRMGSNSQSKIYESITIAAGDVGVSISSITNCLNGRSKSSAGYQWNYVGDK